MIMVNEGGFINGIMVIMSNRSLHVHPSHSECALTKHACAVKHAFAGRLRWVVAERSGTPAAALLVP